MWKNVGNLVQSVQEIYTHIYVFLPNFFHNKKILNIYSYCKVPWLERRSRGDDNLTEGHEHRRLLATNHSCSGPPEPHTQGENPQALSTLLLCFVFPLCLLALMSCKVIFDDLETLKGFFLPPFSLQSLGATPNITLKLLWQKGHQTMEIETDGVFPQGISDLSRGILDVLSAKTG